MTGNAIAVGFFTDIYLPLSMPPNIVWNFWCLNLWYFSRVYVEHAKHASSVLCEDASTSPECLYILTLLCLFLWKLKINNFWKSRALVKPKRKLWLVVSLRDVKRMHKNSWNQTCHLSPNQQNWRESKLCGGCSSNWSSSPKAPCPRISHPSSHPEQVLQLFCLCLSKPPSMFGPRRVLYISPSWGGIFGLVIGFTFGSWCSGWSCDKSKKPSCLLGPCEPFD